MFFLWKNEKKINYFFCDMEKKTNRINNIEEYFLDCACFSHNHSQVDNQKEEKKKQTNNSQLVYRSLCFDFNRNIDDIILYFNLRCN